MAINHLWDAEDPPFPFTDFVPLAERTEKQLALEWHAQRAFDLICDANSSIRYIDGYMLEKFGFVRPPRTRQERLSAAPGRAGARATAARVAFYGGVCWICLAAPATDIDHVIPIARGGTRWPANLRPACRSCNASKKDRWPFDPTPYRSACVAL